MWVAALSMQPLHAMVNQLYPGMAPSPSAGTLTPVHACSLPAGRVAMLAALGFVVGEQLEDFPAFMNWDGDVAGPAIYQFQQIEEKRPLFWEVSR